VRETDPALLADETAKNVAVGISGENSLVVDCVGITKKNATKAEIGQEQKCK
jgi:hypothetical protein